jgi:hypothetical protein
MNPQEWYQQNREPLLNEIKVYLDSEYEVERNQHVIQTSYDLIRINIVHRSGPGNHKLIFDFLEDKVEDLLLKYPGERRLPEYQEGIDVVRNQMFSDILAQWTPPVTV